MSYASAIADFMAFMEANGVKAIEPIGQRLATGSLIRFRCDGDGKGRQNGWAILYLDERPAGAFGNYRMNTGTLKWKSSEDRPALSPEELAGLRREWNIAKEKRESERCNNERQAALAAADLWQRATNANVSHGYVAAKRIDAAPLRQLGDELLVPMTDEAGTLWNLQRIKPDGEKRFLKGGRIDGLFAIIGGFTPDTSEAVLCEGYSTGDAVHRATGLPVVVTFNTANMPRVARLWAEHRPDLNYTVFADDDEATALKEQERRGVYKNPGIETAEAVAAEIGASVAYPLGKPQREAA
jgi:putative DNA primase/helicase